MGITYCITMTCLKIQRYLIQIQICLLAYSIEMPEEIAIDSNYQQTLEYYKDKVDILERQRETWLAKFDQCKSKLQKKQQKQSQLRNLKDSIEQKKKDIIHHQIAEVDEQLSSLNIDRQNQNLEFQEAEQLVRMRELVQEYPIILEKQLPCLNTLLSNELIQNDLNIHSTSASKKLTTKKAYGQSSLNNYKKAKTSKVQHSSSPKSLENLLQLRIIQTKKLNEQEIQLLKHQKDIIKQSIGQFKQKQAKKINKQRKIIKQFTKKCKELEKKHKQLAEGYFEFRRNHKKKIQRSFQENLELKEKYEKIEGKVANEIKIYQKQNKAKQALIIKKSQDFQEDYKAKMRAKERNLQALKESYQKMQEICIEKVRKLEATLEKAKYQLQDSEQRRKIVVQQLREELHNLQKKASEQLLQKARIDLKIKKKLEEEQALQEAKKQREEQAQRILDRQQLIKSAYKKTRVPSGKRKQNTNLSNTNMKKKRNYKKQNVESDDDDDSLDMSDLQKIQKQINNLQNKIVSDDK